MYYADYKGVRDAAWHLLVDLKIQKLPVRMTDICKELGISFKLYTPEDDNDGLSFITNGQAVILVSAGASPEKQRVTAAHELGHILLGHVGAFEDKRISRHAAAPIEQAADMFAGRLLAPACVLWGCNARTPEQIAKLCGISLKAAARLRAERMRVLYKRNKFLASHSEQKVYRQFGEFIAKNQVNL